MLMIETMDRDHRHRKQRLKFSQFGLQMSILAVMLTMILVLTLTGCSNLATATNDTATNTIMTDDLSTSDGTTGMSRTERNFTLTDAKGTSFTLEQAVGKKVYIKFWATWCPICLSGLSDLEQFSQAKSMDSNLVVLTIVSPGVKGEMNREDFIAWYEQQGYTFPVLLDDGGQIVRLYGIRGYPTSVFIDTSGQIVKTQPGHIASVDIDVLLDSIK